MPFSTYTCDDGDDTIEWFEFIFEFFCGVWQRLTAIRSPSSTAGDNVQDVVFDVDDQLSLTETTFVGEDPLVEALTEESMKRSRSQELDQITVEGEEFFDIDFGKKIRHSLFGFISECFIISTVGGYRCDPPFSKPPHQSHPIT